MSGQRVVVSGAGGAVVWAHNTHVGDACAFVWFDDTAALRPLPTRHVDVFEPETYPSGI